MLIMFDQLRTHRGLPAESAHLNFRTLLDGIETGFMVMDRDLVIVYANAAYLSSVERNLDDIVGRYVFDVFPDNEDRVASVRRKFLDVLDGKTTRLDRQKFTLRHPDGTVSTKCWQCSQTPYYDGVGNVRYIVQQSDDITEQEMLRERSEMMSRELDHRVKNLFSVIQAVAALSGHRAESIKEFREEFSARIGAMGRTHDRLREGNWQGLSLKGIAHDGLDQFCGRKHDRVSITGPDVQLSPRGAQHASLLVHELATNAAKYGCFSVPDGRLDIIIRPTGDPHLVEVDWIESGVSGVIPPSRTGFGTQLTEFMPNLICRRDYKDGGLHVRMTARLLSPMDAGTTFDI